MKEVEKREKSKIIQSIYTIHLRKSKIYPTESRQSETKKIDSSKLSKKQREMVAHEDIPWKGSEQSSAPRCSRKREGDRKKTLES